MLTEVGMFVPSRNFTSSQTSCVFVANTDTFTEALLAANASSLDGFTHVGVSFERPTRRFVGVQSQEQETPQM